MAFCLRSWICFGYTSFQRLMEFNYELITIINNFCHKRLGSCVVNDKLVRKWRKTCFWLYLNCVHLNFLWSKLSATLHLAAIKVCKSLRDSNFTKELSRASRNLGKVIFAIWNFKIFIWKMETILPTFFLHIPISIKPSFTFQTFNFFFVLSICYKTILRHKAWILKSALWYFPWKKKTFNICTTA